MATTTTTTLANTSLALLLTTTLALLVGCDSDSSGGGGAIDGGGPVVNVDGSTPPGTNPTAPDGSPPSSSGTACGLRYGTRFMYVVGLSEVIKVHLDGEIDEIAAGITRNGAGGAFYPGGLRIDGSKILLAGGKTPAGTPNPGFWEAPWPPAGGEGPASTIDITGVAITGGANAGPMRAEIAAANIVVTTGNGASLYRVDTVANTSTVFATPKLPAYYRITEILEAQSTAVTVLASIAPSPGVNNRAFTITADPSSSTTEANGLSLSVDKPIVGVRKFDNHSVWFDVRGFYIDGTRVRDVRTCLNGNLRGSDVYGVGQ